MRLTRKMNVATQIEARGGGGGSYRPRSRINMTKKSEGTDESEPLLCAESDLHQVGRTWSQLPSHTATYNGTWAYCTELYLCCSCSQTSGLRPFPKATLIQHCLSRCVSLEFTRYLQPTGGDFGSKNHSVRKSNGFTGACWSANGRLSRN